MIHLWFEHVASIACSLTRAFFFLSSPEKNFANNLSSSNSEWFRLEWCVISALCCIKGNSELKISLNRAHFFFFRSETFYWKVWLPQRIVVIKCFIQEVINLNSQLKQFIEIWNALEKLCNGKNVNKWKCHPFFCIKNDEKWARRWSTRTTAI